MRMYHDVSDINADVNVLTVDMGLDTHPHSDLAAGWEHTLSTPACADFDFDTFLMAFIFASNKDSATVLLQCLCIYVLTLFSYV